MTTPDPAETPTPSQESPVPPAAFPDDRARDGTASVDGPQPAADVAEASAREDLAEAEDIDIPADPDDDPEMVDHVIEAADPRDFADDAGPQYEDEDFDENIDDPGWTGRGPLGAESTDALIDAAIARPAPPPAIAADPSRADGVCEARNLSLIHI